MKTSPTIVAGLSLYLSTLAMLAATYSDTFVPGYSLIANHVNTAGNTMDDIFSFSLPDQTVVYVYNNNLAAFNQPDVFDVSFGWDPNGTLNVGQGAFVYNPTVAPVNHTYSGTTQSPLPVFLPLGQPVCLSRQTPAPATYFDIVGSQPQPGFCTRVYRWNRSQQKYQLYGFNGNSWYPSAPLVPTGEAVFIIRSAADNTAPTLVNATINFGNGKILLQYSEPMNSFLAETLANYSLSGGPGTLVSANMYPVTSPPSTLESAYVQLTATGLNNSFVYKLTINNQADLCGNPLNPSCTQVGLNCTPPPNNSCANATTAVLGANPGTTVCSTTDGYSFCDGACPGGDVWYTYTPPCNGTVTFDTCGSLLDTIVSVWDRCPSMLGASEILCDDDTCGLQSVVTLPVTSCQPFYIRVSGSGGAYGTFILNVSFTPSAPANDLCANAIVLGSGVPTNGVYAFTTCGAATDGPGAQAVNQDIWYRYTPTCSGPVYVSTCGSVFDTALAIYTGTCGSLSLVVQNDNATGGVCNGSQQSFVTFNAIAGTAYYIRVGAPGVQTGCGQLVVVGPNPPAGTCPAGIPPVGTGPNAVYVKLYQVTGNSSGTAWAWSIRAPCCYSVQDLNVPGVLPVNSPPSALIAAFVASINAQCPPFPPSPPFQTNRLRATQVGLNGNFMMLEAYGCLNDFTFSVGPANSLPQNQCVVPLNFLPTAGPCSFNPPIIEIPLKKHDCNTNGIDDLVDILNETSTDFNGNGIPDECENCVRPAFVTKPASQEARPGQKAVFSVEAQGTQPLNYQWFFDDNAIAGATESTLTIDPVRITDAGRYRVAVINDCGERRSGTVRLDVNGRTLQIAYHEGKIEIRWEATDVYLQSAPSVTGSWTTLPNALSPTVISVPSTQQFFRLIER